MGDPNVTPVVTASATSLDGYDTYQLAVTLTGDATNVYTIYGTADSPMSVPPAYQQATPFGANVGGTNPAFWAVMAGAQFDSWLTVGITEGDTAGALSSIGIDFDTWTETNGLGTSDGAVFWMSPDDGPTAGSNAVLAQVTVPTGTAGTATMEIGPLLRRYRLAVRQHRVLVPVSLGCASTGCARRNRAKWLPIGLTQ